jgi:hypothetical protein
MSKCTLAPEEDDPIFSEGPESSGYTTYPSQQTKSQRIGYEFVPGKDGLQMLPWPGTKQTQEPGDNVAIAMRYLLGQLSPRGGRTK